MVDLLACLRGRHRNRAVRSACIGPQHLDSWLRLQVSVPAIFRLARAQPGGAFVIDHPEMRFERVPARVPRVQDYDLAGAFRYHVDPNHAQEDQTRETTPVLSRLTETSVRWATGS